MMKTFLKTLLAVGLALPLSAQAIQLDNGQVLVGEVTEATGDGLSFRRLDTGGVLDLTWDDLSTLSARSIKKLKGLLIEEEEELTILADAIEYKLAGGARDEVVGLIVERSPTVYKLKRKSGVIPIQRPRIARHRKREVPVLEIYTRDEFYQAEAARIAPGRDADRHIELAEQMRRVGLHSRAIEHFEKAVELGNSKQLNQLPAMLERAKRMAEASAERNLLAQIRVYVNRSRFDKAEELIEEFSQTYPESKLQADFERVQRFRDEEREKHYVLRLGQMWDKTVRTVADEKVSDTTVALQTVRSYAEDQMSKDVFERLARVLDITPEDAMAYWERRGEHGNSRASIYSYGIGSWVLGEDTIIEGTKVADAPAGATQAGGGRGGAGGNDRELERLVRKLKEIRQQARKVASRNQGREEETEEDWWRQAPRNERAIWLRTYFVEFGGQMEMTSAYADRCANCAGIGHIIVAGDRGGDQKQRCPVCRGTKFTRTIRAR